jgi:choline dehydrogenase-like flavoprotein
MVRLPMASETTERKFDYVVVGGGSAGCVAAGTLADAGKSVLILEKGPHADLHPRTLDADGYKDTFVNDAVFFDRFSEPQARAAEQRIFLGTGHVLGGSGAVNGMVYTRGSKEDYAEWPVGWRWDDVVPDFETLEARLRPRRREPSTFTEACVRAAESVGFSRSEDFHDGNLSNRIGYEWMNYEGGERRHSYAAFVRGRPGIEVKTGAHVHRVIFEERRAIGVQVDVDGKLQTIRARREVLLAAGALETPKVLLSSGVGPGAELAAHGIPVLLDAPEIGRNLHDHPNVPTFFRSRAEVDFFYPQLYSFYRTLARAALPEGQSDSCYVFWPARSAMKEATQRVLPGQVLPRALYAGRGKAALRSLVGAAFGLGAVQRFVNHLFGIIVILGTPKSRGSVTLRSPDPSVPAKFDPNYLSHPDDFATLVEGLRVARRIAAAPALFELGASELMPGPLVRSERALERFVEKNLITTYHFAGTARMGSEREAPVDPELAVRGLTGLRVADASAVPFTPVSAMNAPSMLVGLRAAKAALSAPDARR